MGRPETLNPAECFGFSPEKGYYGKRKNSKIYNFNGQMLQAVPNEVLSGIC